MEPEPEPETAEQPELGEMGNMDVSNEENNNPSTFKRRLSSIKNLLPAIQSSHDKIHKYFFSSEEGNFRSTLRNPAQFFGPSYFSKPQSIKEVGIRFNKNMSYFFSNYLLLAGLMSVFSVITSPTALIGVILLGVFWVYTMKRESIAIGRLNIGGKPKFISVIIIILLGVFLLGILDAIFYGCTVALALSSIHAVSHKSITLQNNRDPNDIELNSINGDEIVPLKTPIEKEIEDEINNA